MDEARDQLCVIGCAWSRLRIGGCGLTGDLRGVWISRGGGDSLAHYVKQHPLRVASWVGVGGRGWAWVESGLGVGGEWVGRGWVWVGVAGGVGMVCGGGLGGRGAVWVEIC